MKVIQALLVTKGHDFEREPFFQMIDSLQRPDHETFVNWTHIEHPAAEAVLTPEYAEPYDVIIFYDMPGVIFTGSNPPFAHYDPSDAYKESFLKLLEDGKPMIFLHHAIAGWPTWPEFAKIIGGRFHFLPGELAGQSYPGSGYRFRVDQTITVENPDHPIVAGFDKSFSYRDEVYMYPVLEDEVTPLLRSDFEFDASKFRYGGVGFESHPAGSNLVGWTKTYANSSIVYLQFGHDSLAYTNQYFRQLLANAVIWSARQ